MHFKILKMIATSGFGDAENAGVENAAPVCRGGKRESGNRGSLKSMESKDFKKGFLTVLTEHIVWKLLKRYC